MKENFLSWWRLRTLREQRLLIAMVLSAVCVPPLPLLPRSLVVICRLPLPWLW